jgi:SNF2 family DNA or RNA helicase
MNWYDTIDETQQFIIEVLAFCSREVTAQQLHSVISTFARSSSWKKKMAVTEVKSCLEMAARKNVAKMDNNYYHIPFEQSLPYLDRLWLRKLQLNLLREAFIQEFGLTTEYSYYVPKEKVLNNFSAFFQTVIICNSQKEIDTAFLSLDKALVSRKDFNQDPIVFVGFSNIITLAFHFKTITHFQPKLFYTLATFIWRHALRHNVSLNNITQIIQSSGISFPDKDVVDSLLVIRKLLNGQFAEIIKENKHTTEADRVAMAISMFMTKSDDEIESYYTRVLINSTKPPQKPDLFVIDQSIYYYLPWKNLVSKVSVPKINKSLKETIFENSSYTQLLLSALKNLGTLNPENAFFKTFSNNYPFGFREIYIALVCKYWLKLEIAKSEIEILENQLKEATILENNLICLEILQLLTDLLPDSKYGIQLEQLIKKTGAVRTVSTLYTPPSEWDLKLKLLEGINTGLNDPQKQERLIWLANPSNLAIQPVLQKLQKNGNWTAGRNVSLAKLRNEGLECLTLQDARVIKHIAKEQYYDNYWIETSAWYVLAGHPLVFHLTSPEIPLEIEKEDIELVVEEKGKNCVFSYSGSTNTDKITLTKVSPNKYKMLAISDKMQEIVNITGPKLTVPLSAKARILNVLKNLMGEVKIASSLIGEQTGAQQVEASSLLFVHLMPMGGGFKADLLVKPLNPGPPYLKPGEGMTKVVGKMEDKHVWTERNFKKELKNVQLLFAECPVFASQAEETLTATFSEPEECLQVISELRNVPEMVMVEWPRGQKITLKSRLSFENFTLSIKKQNNWFDVSGGLQINENEVLDLKKMLQLLETAKNRFVQIEDGVYIELEKHFIRQLEHLRSVADISAKAIKLHPLAAISAGNLFDSAGNLTADKQWNTFYKNIKSTEGKKYALPKNLAAELRPYQEEGYRWLRKMADWNTGACLADDMGLGKTLQCLTLLLSRASEGPSLVIAPVSVCRNWLAEAAKFTPSLDFQLLGIGDRSEMVNSLTDGQVLVVSYGLLTNEAELLASRKWNTLILDEAQAIKNIATKRAQVAMGIDAKFKITATGTPIQNHIGELWNLFQFLNPGLLGSNQSFNENFVLPIERNNSEIARRTLKDLIKPFILRRTKYQVLEELPEKTEININIELSNEERVFYEALRLKALEEIQKMDDSTKTGEKQMKVLAEIMKLRRACCHPSLASKEIDLPSSKLQRFEELVDDLIENGHKALVFSQFVDHLSIMRKLLDEKGIAYEYLDGSTPGKDREERIHRFQGGSTDLFLISLKAGGVGLNLTAADYVIHMDPWWNPAVEDQASDRAHRIGQTKAVTIYRMVTKDTIEEKIVELHKNKRDLADSLLEGTEAAARVTANDLIEILKNNF